MTSHVMSAPLAAVLRRVRRPGLRPEHRSIMVIDITGSGRWPNQAQLRAREVLRAAVRTAMRKAGIGRPDFAVGDRGDGVMLLITPRVCKVDILDPLIPQLAEQISTHNAAAPDQPRIRLRVAVHAGEVHRDAHGWVGRDLNTAFRLIEGAPLRKRLQQAPESDLVLVVSDLIYQSVVQHHYRAIDPAAYAKIWVSVKEVDAVAWMCFV